MVMVGHLDADHISGVLELTNKLVDQQEKDEEPLSSAVTMFRHESFDDLLCNEDEEPTASEQEAASEPARVNCVAGASGTRSSSTSRD
jgi:phosphoribosyl 1,2-cyclic phosphodiesterase